MKKLWSLDMRHSRPKLLGSVLEKTISERLKAVNGVKRFHLSQARPVLSRLLKRLHTLKKDRYRLKWRVRRLWRKLNGTVFIESMEEMNVPGNSVEGDG